MLIKSVSILIRLVLVSIFYEKKYIKINKDESSSLNGDFIHKISPIHFQYNGHQLRVKVNNIVINKNKLCIAESAFLLYFITQQRHLNMYSIPFILIQFIVT